MSSRRQSCSVVTVSSAHEQAYTLHLDRRRVSSGPGHRPQPGPGLRLVFSSSHRKTTLPWVICSGSRRCGPGELLGLGRVPLHAPPPGGPETTLPFWGPGLELLTTPPSLHRAGALHFSSQLRVPRRGLEAGSGEAGSR